MQYFAAIEPQRRLAPHAHIALRGPLSRAELRQIIAATHHQVWWPNTDEVRFISGCLPVWDEVRSRHVGPATGELLTAWDDALDAITEQDEPRHICPVWYPSSTPKGCCLALRMRAGASAT